MEMNGQIFSIDALFAIIIITIVISGLLFMTAISKGDSTTYDSLRQNAQDTVTINLYKGIYSQSNADGNTSYCETYYDYTVGAVTSYGWCENE